MTLLEAVQQVQLLDRQGTIYAATPWTAGSQVVVAVEDESGRPPAEIERLGLNYFLEVSIAVEVLDGWQQGPGALATAREACERLIAYAVNDC